jgi:hypothetical protein
MAGKYRKFAQDLAHDIENCQLNELSSTITEWIANTCNKLDLGEEQETELQSIILERMSRGLDFGFEQDLEALSDAASADSEEAAEEAAELAFKKKPKKATKSAKVRVKSGLIHKGDFRRALLSAELEKHGIAVEGDKVRKSDIQKVLAKKG